MRNEIYLILAKDKESSVRRALAENPAINDEVQSILKTDNDEVVTSLSFNPALTPRISSDPRVKRLRSLRKNYTPTSEAAIQFNITDSQKKELFDHATSDSLSILALAANMTIDEQMRLLQMISRTVEIKGTALPFLIWPRVALVGNKATDVQILTAIDLSKRAVGRGQDEEYILEALASNVNCPLSILKKLTKKSKRVRWALANPNWYERPLHFKFSQELYFEGGIKAIQQRELDLIARIRKVLEHSVYKEKDIINSLRSILEHGGE